MGTSGQVGRQVSSTVSFNAAYTWSGALGVQGSLQESWGYIQGLHTGYLGISRVSGSDFGFKGVGLGAGVLGISL